MKKTPITVITGPTASGKTALACHFAHKIKGEIIGADSRQVYKFMDIGTGKDLNEFNVNNQNIPYHLIDYIDPSVQYHIQRYKDDFLKTWNTLTDKNTTGILCGGSGLYIQAVCHADIFTQIPINDQLRQELIKKDKLDLVKQLEKYTLKYKVDVNSKKRIIRGIEIHDYLLDHAIPKNPFPEFSPLYFICFSDIDQRKQRITTRLKQRLENGMIEEAEFLLNQGISHEKLQYFGLEYKFLSMYLQNLISLDTLFTQLNTAIHQYAKRQMTWMRRIERNHPHVHFLDVTNKPSTSYLDFVSQTHHNHVKSKR